MARGATLLVLAACVASSLAATRWHQLQGYTFEDYEREFGRSYEGEAERNVRKTVFENRLESIRAHNADPAQTYKRGVNVYSDHTVAELKRRGYDKRAAYVARAKMQAAVTQAKAMGAGAAPPASMDWREKPGVLTPVKNQGECGSCWTFASTESLESQWAIKTGRLEELSEQFILDCTPNPDECGGTGGCMGGTAQLAYARLKSLNGIPSEWTYPYTSGTGVAGKCHGLPLNPQQPHHGSVMAAANVTGHVSVTSNSYADVLAAVATVGPLAVSVDAGAWHDYESGIFDGGNKTNPDLDHLVLLIGYGEENGKDYWIVRNSWTPEWGDNGYIRLARYGGKGDAPCGTDLTPLDGDGCKGGAATVKVCGQNGVLFDAVYPLV